MCAHTHAHKHKYSSIAKGGYCTRMYKKLKQGCRKQKFERLMMGGIKNDEIFSQDV